MEKSPRSRLLAASLVLSAIAFGAASSAIADDKMVLTVSYNNVVYQPFLEEAAKRFEASHPGVDVTYLPPVPTEGEHLTRTFRLAVTGGLPDISLNGYSHVPIMARRKLAVALDGFIKEEKDWANNGLTPASMEATKVRGQIYALPVESSTPTLFFNLDLVRRAGGDPDNLPKDWDGIIALANKIHGLDNKITGAFFDYNASANWTVQAMITSQGGHLMNQDETQIAFNGPEGRKAFDIIRRLGQTGMVDMSQDQAFQAFSAGQIGIITQANTFLSSFEKQAGGRFEIKTMRWPLVPETGRVPIGGRSVMMYTKDAAKQKAAWEYMKFLTTPETQTLLAQMTKTTPANSIAVTSPEFMGKFYDEHPNQKVAVEALPFVTGWYTFPGDNAPRIVDVIHDYARDIAIKQLEVDQALGAMTKDVQALLPQS